MQYLTTAIFTACSCAYLTLASTACITGQTAVLDGVPYYIPPRPVTSSRMSFLNDKTNISGLTPVTIVTTNDSNYNAGDLQVDISNFFSADDVFSLAFAKFILIQYNGQQNGRRSVPLRFSQMGDITDVVWTSEISLDTGIAPGPYFLSPTGAV